jgi:hypothetical protein
MKKFLALLIAMMLGVSSSVFAAGVEESREGEMGWTGAEGEEGSQMGEGEGQEASEAGEDYTDMVKKEVGQAVGGEFNGKSMLKANQLARQGITDNNFALTEAVIAHLKKAGGKRAMATAMQWQKQLEKTKAEMEEPQEEGEAQTEGESAE